jgi:hypothetical protein
VPTRRTRSAQRCRLGHPGRDGLAAPNLGALWPPASPCGDQLHTNVARVLPRTGISGMRRPIDDRANGRRSDTVAFSLLGVEAGPTILSPARSRVMMLSERLEAMFRPLRRGLPVAPVARRTAAPSGRSAPSIPAPDWNVPARSASRKHASQRSAPRRSAPRKLTPSSRARRKSVPLSCAPARLASRRSRLRKIAPDRSAPRRSRACPADHVVVGRSPRLGGGSR